MAETTPSTRRYRNAAAIVDRLYSRVGLDRRTPRADVTGDLVQGDFTYGDGLVVIDEATPAVFDRIKMPVETETSRAKKPNFVCKTAEDLHRAASAAGATIVVDFDDAHEGSPSVLVSKPSVESSARESDQIFDAKS
ncbi:hypothetical protein SAMN06297251_11714 [Fulvimarina manganoxydans]|uniref:Uncharacterized protein n=1 Tax=Fulvimarina manganoxydans TaxID=937218 RepID=A0A1W2DQS2_9HYPH|nr:hypothetical protein [Fulvimarina manganoxydans]MEE2953107.1 hypothetical protein [Pseudomonadota bacterium]SMC99791.1 hypothetical protein SAMN06297251_11714 [Fulvimarina manganoxydans]